MVPGDNQPHSKSPDEPVTIDLTAERVTENQASEETVPVSEDTDTIAAVPESDSSSPPEADATEGSTAREETVADASPAPSEPPSQPATTAPAQKKAASTSGSIAAGIFGGLVALIGAGSIQYAGLIPSLAPAQQAAPAGPDYGADIANLKTEVAGLENKPAAKTDLSPLEGRIAALETSVAALSSQTASGSASSPANDAAIKALGDRLTSLEADLSTAKSNLAEAEKKLAAPKNEIDVGKAIATSALKAAIDRGGPFVSELDTLGNVAPNDPAIAKLQPFAKAGVLSRAQLVKQVPDVADAILNVLNQPAPGTGLTERLVQSALSAIKIRPVGDVEGEGAAAIVARMEEHLQNGDLKGSAEQWDTLPDAAKAVSKDFKSALDNRIVVEGLIGDAMSNAVAGSAVKG